MPLNLAQTSFPRGNSDPQTLNRNHPPRWKAAFCLLAFTPLFLSLILKVQAQNTCKEVIGYYPSWQWYDRNKLVSPSSIHYEKYSIINYAFLNPQSDGSLNITDPWADRNLLLGEFDWSVAPAGYDSKLDLGNPAYHKANTSLIYHAHKKGTKVLISIGGWTLSNNFPSIAVDTAKRTRFAHSCNEVIRLYGIDGIDLDWEYPGYAPHNGSGADKAAFTALLHEVRDSLDALEYKLGRHFLFTAAFGAARDHMKHVDWQKVLPALDYINLMSYDFFGAFSSETNHNAPLYPPRKGDNTFNVDSAAQYLMDQYKVPATKLNVGVAFYGRSAKTVSTPVLHGATTGSADLSTFSMDDGTPLYYNVLAKKHLFTEGWDSSAQVPYLLGNAGLNTFVSYDDPNSIRLKAQYVRQKGLAGVIIWELTGDYIESAGNPGQVAGTPLLDTLNRTLCLKEDSLERIVVYDTVCSVYQSPGGKWWDSSAVYFDTVRGRDGALKLYTIHLIRNRPGFDSIQVETCSIYKAPSGQEHTMSGVFRDTLATRWGCDSIITINLTLHGIVSDSVKVNHCGPYLFNGEIYALSGIYTDTLKSDAGCDSLVVLDLRIEALETDSFEVSDCRPYYFNGRIFSKSGIYSDTLQNKLGCDSVVVMKLDLTQINTRLIQLSDQLIAIEDSARYQWLDCDNGFAILEGETNRDLKARRNGNFAVELHKRDCTDTSDCFTVIILGMDGSDAQFRLFPNPSAGFFTLELNNPIPSSIAVYNSVGMLVLERRLDVAINSFQVEGEPGVYTVVLRIGDYLYRRQLLKY